MQVHCQLPLTISKEFIRFVNTFSALTVEAAVPKVLIRYLSKDQYPLTSTGPQLEFTYALERILLEKLSKPTEGPKFDFHNIACKQAPIRFL